MLTVDDVEGSPDSAETNPQVYVALAELWKEKRWTLYRTLHEAQAWKLGGNLCERLIRRRWVGNGRC